MKLLFCEDCGDIVAPDRQKDVSRACSCGRHYVWWDDPARGQLRLHDARGAKSGDGTPYRPAAFVIGLHNGILADPAPLTTKELIDRELAETPDSYLFKTAGSLVIKLRPGMSGDTRWMSWRPEGRVAE